MDQNKEVIRSRTTQSRTPSNEIKQIRDGSDVELTAATELFVLAPDWLGRRAEQKEIEEKMFTFAASQCFSPQTAQLPWLPWRDTLPCHRWSGATHPRSPLWGRWWPRATGPCPFYPSLRWFSCRKEMQSDQPIWNWWTSWELMDLVTLSHKTSVDFLCVQLEFPCDLLPTVNILAAPEWQFDQGVVTCAVLSEAHSNWVV